MDVTFLTLDEVVAIHRDQIERYGGSYGIRDIGLLQSAVATPSASFGGEYLHEDLYQMGAAYLFHIVQNHPFLDGNKRTGAVAALVFLDLNGVRLVADEIALEELVRNVATSRAQKADITLFLRGCSAE